VYQYYRKKKKDRTVYIDEGSIKPFFSELVYESEDIYENESNDNLLQRLTFILKDKALKDIELIEMRFFEKRAFKEIGEILNITENNAKVRVYRALDKLRESLIPQMKSI
jgi:RNA polymerase sigma-70 factor (ECF subfamily)